MKELVKRIVQRSGVAEPITRRVLQAFGDHLNAQAYVSGDPASANEAVAELVNELRNTTLKGF